MSKPHASWRDNVSIALVAPKEAGNIGASARAMKNMGFQRLELVAPKNFPAPEAVWMAANAKDVLNSAVIHKSLAQALKDKSLVVGATRRAGRGRGLMLDIREAARIIAKTALKNQVAIVFGREDRGLLNSEVQRCDFLLRIPTSGEDPSLNLAQAVMLVAYELRMLEYKRGAPEFVPQSEAENILRRIGTALKLLGYEGGREKTKRDALLHIRRLLRRAGITKWDAGMIHGLLSSAEMHLKKKME